MKLHQKLYQLMTAVHTKADNHGKEYPEFNKAPDGFLGGQRQPRRAGLYLWRYTPKWPTWFRRVVTLPNSSCPWITLSEKVGLHCGFSQTI